MLRCSELVHAIPPTHPFLHLSVIRLFVRPNRSTLRPEYPSPRAESPVDGQITPAASVRVAAEPGREVRRMPAAVGGDLGAGFVAVATAPFGESLAVRSSPIRVVATGYDQLSASVHSGSISNNWHAKLSKQTGDVGLSRCPISGNSCSTDCRTYSR
jgi:hypothetical protein